jgi:TrmH family RNA methyltransferase
MSVLSSKDNPKVKHWAKLVRDARYRAEERRTLIEGPHLLEAFQQAGLEPKAVLVTEKALDRKELSALAGKAPTVVTESVFRAIVEADNPPGIAAEIEIPVRPQRGEHVVFLEGVQDPGNVGAILRNAAAFGVGKVVLDKACADPWSPRALRAGMGGQFVVAVREVAKLDFAGFEGTLLCTVVRGGIRLQEADLVGALGWIFGGEGRGVSAEVERQVKVKVTIPIAPGIESLNVAGASAICLYEGFSRRS